MRKYGLLGFPLDHSLSPEIYREIFADNGNNYAQYDLIPIASESLLKDFLQRKHDWEGFNVTIPYKKKVLHLMDWVSEEAAETGAVNCIKVGKGEEPAYSGYNTDFLAFLEIIRPVIDGRDFCALVLGSGGSAASVMLALKKLGDHLSECLQVT